MNVIRCACESAFFTKESQRTLMLSNPPVADTIALLIIHSATVKNYAENAATPQ